MITHPLSVTVDQGMRGGAQVFVCAKGLVCKLKRWDSAHNASLVIGVVNLTGGHISMNAEVGVVVFQPAARGKTGGLASEVPMPKM